VIIIEAFVVVMEDQVLTMSSVVLHHSFSSRYIVMDGFFRKEQNQTEERGKNFIETEDDVVMPPWHYYAHGPSVVVWAASCGIVLLPHWHQILCSKQKFLRSELATNSTISSSC
jgi:hypothetical protein